MEKYKLKKDTLFYKAGTICKLTPKGNLVLDGCEGTCVINRYKLEKFPGLLEEWFEKFKERKYGGRVPKEGDKYWFIASGGSIIDDTWADEPADHVVFECGSAFWNEEKAEKELKRRKAYVILKEDTKGFKPDWQNRNAKWRVYHDDGVLSILDDYYLNDGALHFATAEDALASIKAHRQQWLDYLGVEEEE